MAYIGNKFLTMRRLQQSSTSFFIKALCNSGHPLGLTFRYASDSANLNVAVDSTSGIAVLELKRKPVNSLNLDFLNELNAALEKLENDRQTKGLVITSAQPKIFSAGLDLLEMYNPKPERMRAFWRALQNFWMKLYLSPLATAAAINGHSPAGGCVVALSCDYRVMASGSYAIGLNETLLGIVAPIWFIDIMKNVIGQRESEKALQLGRLYSADEALKVGLIDEVAPESAVVQHAKQELLKWLQIPAGARQITKLALRQPTVDKLLARLDEDVEIFASLITKDSIQKGLAKYLESLKRKN